MKTTRSVSTSRHATGSLKRSVLVALVALTAFACTDVPLLPTWDTEWSFPLVSRTNDQFFGTFSITVASGAQVPVSFPIERIQLDQRLGAILGERMKAASLVIVVSKALAVSGSYTLALSRDSAGLRAAPDSGIALRFSIAPHVQLNADSAAISASGLAMLQSIADNRGLLWVQMRGTTTFPGPGTLVIVPGDSISVQLTLRATIASSN
jgi:hypothetical protein